MFDAYPKTESQGNTTFHLTELMRDLVAIVFRVTYLSSEYLQFYCNFLLYIFIDLLPSGCTREVTVTGLGKISGGAAIITHSDHSTTITFYNILHFSLIDFL